MCTGFYAKNQYMFKKKLDIKMYLKLQRIFLQLPLCPLFFALTTWSLDLDLNTLKNISIDTRFLLFLFNVLFVHLKMDNTDVSITWNCHLCQQYYLILTNDKRLSLWLFILYTYMCTKFQIRSLEADQSELARFDPKTSTTTTNKAMWVKLDSLRYVFS